VARIFLCHANEDRARVREVHLLAIDRLQAGLTLTLLSMEDIVAMIDRYHAIKEREKRLTN
jgi:hypothetical protein